MEIRKVKEIERRLRDSNPRYGFPYTHFPGVPLQPLEQVSGGGKNTLSKLDAK